MRLGGPCAPHGGMHGVFQSWPVGCLDWRSILNDHLPFASALPLVTNHRRGMLHLCSHFNLLVSDCGEVGRVGCASVPHSAPPPLPCTHWAHSDTANHKLSPSQITAKVNEISAQVCSSEVPACHSRLSLQCSMWVHCLLRSKVSDGCKWRLQPRETVMNSDCSSSNRGKS